MGITQSLLDELDREYARWAAIREGEEEEDDSDTETVVEVWEDPFKTPPSGYSPAPDGVSDIGD